MLLMVGDVSFVSHFRPSVNLVCGQRAVGMTGLIWEGRKIAR